MTKKILTQRIVTATVAGLTLSGMGTAAASNVEEFLLQPVVVTAQRYQTREVATPAAVEVYDAQRIKATGAANVQEVLKYGLGITYSGMGPGGNSYASSTADSIIRGMKGGTLVMINGRPINTRGLAFLDQYPVNNVERIEVIRGGGSVLYGTNATGGVINIITKRQADNSVFLELGSYGQRNAGTSIKAGKLALNYTYNRWGAIDTISLNTWQSIANDHPKNAYFNNDFKGSHSDNIALTYEFNDEWSLFYAYNDKSAAYTYAFYENDHNASGQDRYYRNYNYRQNTAQLNYHTNQLKASIYYNDLSYQSRGIDFLTAAGKPAVPPASVYKLSADEQNRNLGIDVQYDWEQTRVKYLVGGTAQYEYYKPERTAGKDYSRINYSLYSSADYALADSVNAILALRYSWQGSAPHENLDKLTPQLQLRKQLTAQEYLYASAGMSYTMPTFKQTGATDASKVTGNPLLKPQTGMHYELGWKRDYDQHGLRVALFKYNIEDQITASATADTWKYVNEDSKNTGLEIEYTYAAPSVGWHYNVGMSVGDPQTKNSARKGLRSQHWERAYDRYQLNSGIGYSADKWSVNLLGKYVFGRVKSSLSSVEYGPSTSKPALYTTLTARYQLDKGQEIYLKAENLFDRKDIINNSSAEYYYTPFNIVVGYMLKF